jgi:hypothetical protein
VGLRVTNYRKLRLWKSCATFAFIVFLAYLPRCSAQQITGRFYPEKRDYLVGEPIIVVFEMVNSTSDTLQIGEGGCYEMSDQFHVDNAASKKKFTLFGCIGGMAGSCMSSTRDISTGGRYEQRLLLEGNFELNSPGSYHIRARREQKITRKGVNGLGLDLKVDSQFDVLLHEPTEGSLEAAYQPLLNDLNSRDYTARSLAARAITQNPPRFAEPAILAMADDSITWYTSVEGLKRLGTPAARAKLLEMSSISSAEYRRQPAIAALGEIANADDCQTMLNIAAESKNYTQIEAYVAAGSICKQEAVTVFSNVIATADPPLVGGLTYALKNTMSREAVSPLIGLLQNLDVNVRRQAVDALEMLTHRESHYGVEDADAAIEAYREWSRWWSDNGKTAPLYSPNECVAPQPFG